MHERCESPLDLGLLSEYHAAELEEAVERQVEEHFFACETCARRLAWVESFGEAVTKAVRSGAISAAVSSRWVERAVTEGIRIRSYTLQPGGTVACTASPTDDFVVVRLRVKLPAGTSVDIETEFADLESGGSGSSVRHGVSIDAHSGEVVYAFPGDRIRAYPRSRWTLHVRPQVQGASPVPAIGPFTMDHTPWAQLANQP